MGCKYEIGINTKCCFDCEYTHCPYMCSGINHKMHRECDYYVKQKYECVQEEKDKK